MSRTIARSPEDEQKRYAWITTGRAAELIGGDKPVSTSHVVRLIEAGQLTARNVSLGKRADWRIDPESVERFLDRRTSKAA